MSTHTLRPWSDLVKLHPDVEEGTLTEALFAIDLGAIAAGDPNVPVVNRDPESFFRAAESCLRELYTAVWLPRVEEGSLSLEKVERGGRPLQATGVHERIMELLTAIGTPRIHGSVTPRKITERVRLGEILETGPIMGIKVSDVIESFFRDITPPLDVISTGMKHQPTTAKKTVLFFLPPIKS